MDVDVIASLIEWLLAVTGNDLAMAGVISAFVSSLSGGIFAILFEEEEITISTSIRTVLLGVLLGVYLGGAIGYTFSWTEIPTNTARFLIAFAARPIAGMILSTLKNQDLISLIKKFLSHGKK